MARMGRPESSAMALPRPVVEPPPKATAQSASSLQRARVPRARFRSARASPRGRRCRGARAQQLRDLLRRCALPQARTAAPAPGAPQRLDLPAQLRDRTGAEHHPARLAVEQETSCTPPGPPPGDRRARRRCRARTRCWQAGRADGVFPTRADRRAPQAALVCGTARLSRRWLPNPSPPCSTSPLPCG